jgi:hypothetical protein
MDDVRELVSYLSKAERGYTKTLNRESRIRFEQGTI